MAWETQRMRPQALLIAYPHQQDYVFPDRVRKLLLECVDLAGNPCSPDDLPRRTADLATAEVIISTWGMPIMDADFLAAAPRLKAVFYAAGSVKEFVTEASWGRGVVVSSAAEANAIPVAEYTVGSILLSLKRVWHFSRLSHTETPTRDDLHVAGSYRSKVGIVSAGAVGRAIAKILRPFDLELLLYDPYVSPRQAAEINAELVSLEELFRECDAISVNAPWLPESEGMINGRLISSMKEGATLINTSRGAVVAEEEIIEVLRQRPDLSAVLDVTMQENLPLESPLRQLPNVILTPHIAGSLQGECERMGSCMADELRRYVTGEPLLHAVTKNILHRRA